MSNEVRQWAEDHGEIPMTMEQFQAEESQAKQDRLERGSEVFTLELTADELDWLLFEIMQHAALEALEQKKPSKELDIRASIDQWWQQAAKQGYAP